MDCHSLATDNVKKCWVRQGIWKDKLKSALHQRWTHCEPLGLPFASDEAHHQTVKVIRESSENKIRDRPRGIVPLAPNLLSIDKDR